MHGARAGGARDARFAPPPPGADAPAPGTPAGPPGTVGLPGLARGRPTPPPPPPASFYGAPPGFAYGAAVPMPGTARVPELTYMESQLTTQAVLVNQQRRIKQLEADLFSTQAEVIRLQNAARERERERPADAAAQDGEGKKPSSRYWTPDEHKRFLEGLELYGPREIKSISRHVGTRSATQVRTHAQKYYLRIERERAKENAAAGAAPNTTTSGKPGSSTGSAAAARAAGQNQQTQQRKITGPAQPALPRHAAPSAGSHPMPVSMPQGSTATSATPVAPATAGGKASASPQSPRRTSARRSPPSPRSGKGRARPRARAQSGELLRLAADLPNGRAGDPATNAGPESAAAATGGTPSGGPPDGEEPRKRPLNASPARGSPARRVKARPMSEPARAGAAVPRVASSGALAHLPRVPSGLGPWGAAAGDAKAEPTLAASDGAPSAQKPPSLRRNESSNSVLADLAKGAAAAAPLSRSNSFLSRDGGAGRGFHRTNSILSLLSGFPTAGLHQSSSTERLLGLDGADDKLLATLKAADAGNAAAGASAAPPGAAQPAAGPAGRESLGDRSLSFGQLENMAALADFDDPSSVAIALQEDKWNAES